MTVPIAGRGPEVLALFVVFLALSTVSTALRVYCRAILGRSRGTFGMDDIFTIFAWAGFTCFVCMGIIGVQHGTGQHAWNIIPASNIPIGLKYWWLCEPLYVVSSLFIKASIGVMLLRLTIEKSHRVIIWTVLVVTTTFSIGFLLYFIFQCWPVQYFWTRHEATGGGTGTCLNPEYAVKLTYTYSAILCLGDWTFAILPCVIVWGLQMPRTQKLLVGFVLAMGTTASTATIARIPYIKGMRNEADFLYATTDVAIWSTVETGLAITASSCACLGPIFRRIFAKSAFNASHERSKGPSRAFTPNSAAVSRQLYAPDGDYGYTVNVKSAGREPSDSDVELSRVPAGGIRVDQQDSASFESVARSMSSTTEIVESKAWAR